MTPLTVDEIELRLRALTGWSVDDNNLIRIFKFATFPDGIKFVDQVAVLAETAGHHPDIDIRYNKITIRLSTHDAGGITAKDFELAEQMSKLNH